MAEKHDIVCHCMFDAQALLEVLVLGMKEKNKMDGMQIVSSLNHKLFLPTRHLWLDVPGKLPDKQAKMRKADSRENWTISNFWLCLTL